MLLIVSFSEKSLISTVAGNFLFLFCIFSLNFCFEWNLCFSDIFLFIFVEYQFLFILLHAVFVWVSADFNRNAYSVEMDGLIEELEQLVILFFINSNIYLVYWIYCYKKYLLCNACPEERNLLLAFKWFLLIEFLGHFLLYTNPNGSTSKENIYDN